MRIKDLTPFLALGFVSAALPDRLKLETRVGSVTIHNSIRPCFYISIDQGIEEVSFGDYTEPQALAAAKILLEAIAKLDAISPESVSVASRP